MLLRRDHVAGAFFLVAGAVVLASSGDLPFGDLAFPGAGMVPKLVAGLIVILGAAVMLSGGASPPLASVAWADFPHALRVLSVAIPAVAVYATAGFLITTAVLLFGLLFVIERQPLLASVAFSLGVTAGTWFVFGTLLKSPLPAGLIGY